MTRPVVRASAAVLSAVALVFASAGCASSGASSRDGLSTYVSADKRVTVFAPESRKPAPALAGRTLTGSRLDVASHRGDVVVLNVWGTYCGPCRKEMPLLQRTSTELAAKGVRFIGIDTRDDDPQARSFLQRYRVTFPSLVDPDGELVVRFGGTVPAGAVPSTLVIDRSGRIAARAVGAVDEAALKAMLDPVVAEPA